MQIEQALNSGSPKLLNTRKALNKAFLKIKQNCSQIERFKQDLTKLLDRTNDSESEEFHKNLVTNFLNRTYYKFHPLFNTNGYNHLVIYNGNKAATSVELRST